MAEGLITQSIKQENSTDPIDAIQRNQCSLPRIAKSSMTTEKSRLATFLSMKSAQAACTGVFSDSPI
ncbi:hypothetical protein EMGBD2_06590 [Nitrospirota bacterium]|nr:hypothetical protein EMGBD2_06590 [Nitrospirota bacterium]